MWTGSHRVLFFAADPHSRPPQGRDPRLRLDDDVRTIREKVRMAKHRDALDFDARTVPAYDVKVISIAMFTPAFRLRVSSSANAVTNQ